MNINKVDKERIIHKKYLRTYINLFTSNVCMSKYDEDMMINYNVLS